MAAIPQNMDVTGLDDVSIATIAHFSADLAQLRQNVEAPPGVKVVIYNRAIHNAAQSLNTLREKLIINGMELTSERQNRRFIKRMAQLFILIIVLLVGISTFLLREIYTSKESGLKAPMDISIPICVTTQQNAIYGKHGHYQTETLEQVPSLPNRLPSEDNREEKKDIHQDDNKSENSILPVKKDFPEDSKSESKGATRMSSDVEVTTPTNELLECMRNISYLTKLLCGIIFFTSSITIFLMVILYKMMKKDEFDF